MFGFGKTKSIAEPHFIIGNSSVFSKNRLTPTEFGQDIMNLGFQFGTRQFDSYIEKNNLTLQDSSLITEVMRNPGIIQLLYSNLVAGCFLCYVKVFLKPPEDVLKDIEDGILIALREKMPILSEEVLKNHQKITVNFSFSLENEIKEIDVDASLNLLFTYIKDYYPHLNFDSSTKIPLGFQKSTSGLGSRFANVCQNFNLSFHSK